MIKWSEQRHQSTSVRTARDNKDYMNKRLPVLTPPNKASCTWQSNNDIAWLRPEHPKTLVITWTNGSPSLPLQTKPAAPGSRTSYPVESAGTTQHLCTRDLPPLAGSPSGDSRRKPQKRRLRSGPGQLKVKKAFLKVDLRLRKSAPFKRF